jgi:hypothetical protein
VEPTLPFDQVFVRAAYEPVVKHALEAAARWNAAFSRTHEDQARLAALREAEEDRRVSLMKAHQNEPGTTDVCRCGFTGYSTPGYLLHLYDVIEGDCQGGDW